MPVRLNRRKVVDKILPPRFGSKRWMLRSAVKERETYRNEKGNPNDPSFQLFMRARERSQDRVDEIRKELKGLTISRRKEAKLKNEMRWNISIIRALDNLRVDKEELRRLKDQVKARKKIADSRVGKLMRIAARPSILRRGPPIIKALNESTQYRIIHRRDGSIRTMRRVK